MSLYDYTGHRDPSGSNARITSQSDPHDCADCVAEYSTSSMDMTSQCTDQCVVITCNDPAHSDANNCSVRLDCCDVWCQEPTDACKSCSSTSNDLDCCLDFTHCMSTLDVEQQQQLQKQWEDLDALSFMCSCTEDHIPGDQNAFSIESSRQGQYPTSTPYGPSPSSHSFTQNTNDVFSNALLTSSSTLAYPPSSALTSAPALGQLTCMWANCQSRFTSSQQLVEHVNTQHLVDTLFGCQPLPDQQTSCQVSCLWGDCHEQLFADFNSRNAGTSHSHADALSMHLFENHLNFGALDIDTHLNQISQPPHLTPHGGIDDNHHFSFPQQDHIDTASSSSSAPTPRFSASPSLPTSPTTPQATPPSIHSHVNGQCTRNHVCLWDSCGKVFDTCSQLTEHLTNDHVGSGKQRYECLWEGCTRNYKNAGKDGEKDGGFTSKQKICRHLQSHTGHRPFQCSVCHQNFSEAATLQQHMRRHTLEKPYVCDYPGCGKAFSITGALTIHKRTHNGQKPFKCTFCDRAFAESSNLSKHLRTHTGVRPYACNEPGCGKTFARPDQLSRHSRVHRKKIAKVESGEAPAAVVAVS
ncbi:zinc-finger protein [Marasmius sp. AFHP31]|nr:zinc-finger protein [Marasmius sp. AFHP31]